MLGYNSLKFILMTINIKPLPFYDRITPMTRINSVEAISKTFEFTSKCLISASTINVIKTSV